jgi:hypothetical protein
MGMVIFPACDNPLDQGTGAKPAIGEDVPQDELLQDELSLGRVWIRFTVPGTKQRNLYPEIENFSQYVLSFTREDGETVPDAVIKDEDHLSVDLTTGMWNITAIGFAAREGGQLAAAARGSVNIPVEAGTEIHTLITLDTIIP